MPSHQSKMIIIFEMSKRDRYMKIGYARVSTQDQKLELQLDALAHYGCEQIFKEKKSGKSKDRPELERMISQLRSGDTVVVWKLDRLGRSLKDLIELVSDFKERGVEFVSLQDGINTTTPTGKFTFNIFASLAEFEREMELQCFTGDFFRQPLLGFTTGFHTGKASGNLVLSASFSGYRSLQCTQIRPAGPLV